MLVTPKAERAGGVPATTIPLPNSQQHATIKQARNPSISFC
jgi:hypothetical protein